MQPRVSLLENLGMSTTTFPYYARMKKLVVLALLVHGAAACTRRNEAKYCDEGTCTTPDFPFCDVTGGFSGEEGTCIAVTCVAGEFGECRGDREVRCSENGTNYDVLQCERGCDPDANGCRPCNPSETTCTNGKVTTCDAHGNVTSVTECPAGCYQGEPRCTEIVPANGLVEYLDLVPNPPDLDLADAFFNTASGVVTDGPTSLFVPSFTVQRPAYPPIRVFIAGSVRIAKAFAGTQEDARTLTGPAFALVARGEVVITGSFGAASTAGAVSFSLCNGADGVANTACGNVSSGGGGGAHATSGGTGGTVISGALGGTKGIAHGTPELEPLRGGCAGGGVTFNTNRLIDGGPGGGAIQITSAASIHVHGTIDVRGTVGYVDGDPLSGERWIGGGGAGGGILLEAPYVELGPAASLLAGGGDGGSGCVSPTSSCALGGGGAGVNSSEGGAGNSVSCGSGTTVTAGGGGGGLGRVRINTPTSSYSKSATTVVEAQATTGIIATR